MDISSLHRLPYTWDSVQAATSISHDVSRKESGPEPLKEFRQESVIRRVVGYCAVSWASKRSYFPLSSQRGQEEWVEGPS